ncbi:hypothetical protein GCM10027176_33630 [Actinoallomurus bryophytorum]|uniref:Uncharacterized protein n=1 Tax=Actinoallomurus bryophytorum TaxID=1490222 RepID=A0A543CNA1_9ACTN|nr:hypothetical protein [Actinoallomurus bryophytorum]TQL98440.1 hypothetical protein FB559_4065 [Actinoallomurus bryophytorum]
MGWFKSRKSGHNLNNTDGSPSVGSCDCCGVNLDRTQGYYVATTDIVMSEPFWRNHIEPLKIMADMVGTPRGNAAGLDEQAAFHTLLTSVAGNEAPWLICEKCSAFFDFERDEARSYAVRGVSPRKSGPVNPNECAVVAGAAWEYIFGHRPSSPQTLAGPTGSTSRCDSCSAPLDRAQGYYLATADVVVSEAYWRLYATKIRAHMMEDDAEWDEHMQLLMFARMLQHVASSRTPWLICEDCSEFFLIKRDEARSHAVSEVSPPKCGPVDPSECVQVAAKAWEHVFGRWPASAEQPEVVDSCDLCAKKIYRRETAGSVGRARFEEFRASGIIDSAPLSPPRPGDKWLLCQICLKRMIARIQRAGLSTPVAEES